MIPRADVESIPYVVSLATLMLYIYLLQIYDVRKKSVEYIGLMPILFTWYNLWLFRLEYSYVFSYTYSGMEPLGHGSPRGCIPLPCLQGYTVRLDV